MNWRLIFVLSLFGLVMSFITIYWVSSSVEPYLWVVVAMTCAYFIAQKAPGKYFLHGFLLSIIDTAWVTGGHIIFSGAYLANHPAEAAEFAKMNRDFHFSVAKAMLLMSPFLAIISGLFFGLFAFIAAKILKK